MEPGSPPRGDDADLRSYARRNVALGFVVLVALFGGLGLVGIRYARELEAMANAVAHALGVPGLALLIVAADAATAPVPPDLVLVVVAKSELSARWIVIVPLLGIVSAASGSLGYLVGIGLGRTRSARIQFERWRRSQDAVVRWGRWGVALGALTPVPFSLTCWAAGMVHMRYRDFFWVTLLRVPRFVVYYWAIAASGTG